MGSQSYFQGFDYLPYSTNWINSSSIAAWFSMPKVVQKAEQIILKYVVEHIPQRSITSSCSHKGLHFHDCFVNGCDGSVLVELNTRGIKLKRNAIPNLTISEALGFIEAIKRLVEAECPGGSLLVLISWLWTARDSIHATGGPYWNVPTGRRDGFISRAADPLRQPSCSFSQPHYLTQPNTLWAMLDLNANDLVLLVGAHTIGIAHCSSISTRLYNFTGKGGHRPNNRQWICKKSQDLQSVRTLMITHLLRWTLEVVIHLILDITNKWLREGVCSNQMLNCLLVLSQGLLSLVNFSQLKVLCGICQVYGENGTNNVKLGSEGENKETLCTS
uniref:Peroxidase n=1 Tax=Glycine max TaxID=3847 RepID=Q9ZTW8_SOYBN|nr:peroxidase [Glycine max]